MDERKIYYENNKEEIRKKQKNYYENNKNQIREQHKAYYNNNRDYIIERNTTNSKIYHDKKKIEKKIEFVEKAIKANAKYIFHSPAKQLINIVQIKSAI